MNRRPIHFDCCMLAIMLFGIQHVFNMQAAKGQGTDPRVRITVICPDGTLSIGSGAMVKWNDEPRVALTASHIFDDGVKKISVCVAERGCFPAELIGRDEENDLAAIRLTGLKDYLVYPIAESDPPNGTVVELHGYGNTQAGDPKSFTGRVVGRGNFGNEPGDGLLLITIPVREGDSGGPVTVKSGIVGVISGSEGGGQGRGQRRGQATTMVTYNSGVEWVTMAPACSRIRAFLGRLFPRIAARPPPGRRIGPPVGTVPRGPVLPGPAPAVIGPWAANEPTPGGIFPFKPLVPVVPRKPAPTEPVATNPAITTALGKVLEGLDTILGRLNKPPPAPKAIEPVAPIVGPEPAIVTNPSPEKKSGIPWASLLGLAIPVVAGASGVGLPWAALAYRAARLAKRLREAHEATPAGSEPPHTIVAGKEGPPGPIGPAGPKGKQGMAGSEPPTRESTYDISYHPQPIDPGLLRMRKAMQLTSDEYPAAMTWVKRFEKVFSLLQSGEIK